MSNKFYEHLTAELKKLQQEFLYKQEQIITSAQAAVVKTADGSSLINMCSDNYLGLANNQELIDTAKKSLDIYGFGLSSARFICGTQSIHKELEHRLSQFLGMEDTILYSSFNTSGGIFAALFEAEDAIISDSLNHPNTIDGIKLCKAQRFRYSNNDMVDLELKLKEAQYCRYKIIATDGVFFMDGTIANLPAICELAARYDAMLAVDDSHAVGVIGENGCGSHEYHDVINKIDIITGSLGKALGGASGGYASGKKEIIDWLRQKSHPYLFSNSLAPVITATSIKVLDLIGAKPNLRLQLKNNSLYLRSGLTKLGFNLIAGEHPIIPVVLGEAQLAKTMVDKLLQEGICVASFFNPTVAHSKARIRLQVSAAHEREQLDKVLNAFSKIGKDLGIIN